MSDRGSGHARRDTYVYVQWAVGSLAVVWISLDRLARPLYLWSTGDGDVQVREWSGQYRQTHSRGIGIAYVADPGISVCWAFIPLLSPMLDVWPMSSDQYQTGLPRLGVYLLMGLLSTSSAGLPPLPISATLETA